MDWISDLIAFCAPCSGFGRQWDSDRHPQGWKERCQAQKWCSVSKYFWDLSRDRYVLLPQSRLVPVLCPDHPRKYVAVSCHQYPCPVGARTDSTQAFSAGGQNSKVEHLSMAWPLNP